jgi:hypothetical protein
MNTLDSAHQLAREYPGGIEALAPRLGGKSAFTLRHELTRQGTSKLGLLDAEAMTLYAMQVNMANPLRILNAFAQNCGGVVLRMPDQIHGQGGDTLKDLAEAATAFSTFVSSVASSVADGEISANELREVDRRLSALVGHSQAVRERLAAMHEAAKPADACGG